MRRFLLVLIILLQPGCVTTPESGKRAFIITSEGEEAKLGVSAYSEILQKEKRSTNTRQIEILRRVGERIAKASGRNDFQWEFTLIESKEKNAFCLPGGKVAFYTAILPVCLNEAGLAVVMGHEVAHATARHSGQRISMAMGMQLGMGVVDVMLGEDSTKKNLLMGALGIGATVGAVLPFSRAHESEADSIGLIYAARAGYDPNEAPKFWDRFGKETAGKSPPAFLSTHPPSESRMNALREQIPRVLPEYEKSAKYGSGEVL